MDTKDFRTRHHELITMLALLGCPATKVKFRSWREISGHAIVKVNSRKDGNWHWVVYDGGRRDRVVHDPKPGKRGLVRDLRGLKGSGFYVAVQATPNYLIKRMPFRGTP